MESERPTKAMRCDKLVEKECAGLTSPQKNLENETTTKSQQVFHMEDAFKIWTYKIGRKDGGTEPRAEKEESILFAAGTTSASCLQAHKSFLMSSINNRRGVQAAAGVCNAASINGKGNVLLLGASVGVDHC